MEAIKQRDPIVYERLKKTQEYEDEAMLFDYLHEKGYTAFNIPKLTIHEIASFIVADKKHKYEAEKYARRK